jgi:predicted nucleic acid-binding protein
LTRIAEALDGVRRLAIDTAPLIYLVERHPDFGALVREVVQRAEAGELELVTSSLTLTEVLSQPYSRGDEELAAIYRSILLETPYLRVLPVDSQVAERAARLRAAYRLKTPDAIQLAVASGCRCDAFLTNDNDLARVEEPRVLLLNRLERSA